MPCYTFCDICFCNVLYSRVILLTLYGVNMLNQIVLYLNQLKTLIQNYAVGRISGHKCTCIQYLTNSVESCCSVFIRIFILKKVFVPPKSLDSVYMLNTLQHTSCMVHYDGGHIYVYYIQQLNNMVPYTPHMSTVPSINLSL